jgi:hypothetical protein
MARPREYATDAERQRAFRRRQAQETVRVDRALLDQLHCQLIRLQLAVVAAAAAGDATARACRSGSVETVLERLTQHFEAQAGGAVPMPAADPALAGKG